tara:strand:- start:281 stop:742 length:462 start_codon:yes stop_codon:yes gene_type:complete
MTLITIELEPKGKGRPRVTFKGGYARAYTPASTAKWERAAVAILRSQWKTGALVQPVRIHIDAISKRPIRLCRKKDPEGLIFRAALPDADNVAKAVLDAIQKAQIIENDKQVVDLRIRSLYAEKNAAGRVVIAIEKVKEEGCDIQSVDRLEGP